MGMSARRHDIAALHGRCRPFDSPCHYPAAVLSRKGDACAGLRISSREPTCGCNKHKCNQTFHILIINVIFSPPRLHIIPLPSPFPQSEQRRVRNIAMSRPKNTITSYHAYYFRRFRTFSKIFLLLRICKKQDAESISPAA